MNSNQKKLVFRIFVSGFILLFIFIFNVFFSIPAISQLLFFLVSYLIVGYDVLIKTFKNSLKFKFFNEQSLMFIATIGAFFLKQYFEAVIVFLLYQVGELFQDIAVDRSKNQITNVLHIRSEYANLKQDSVIKKVSPLEINIGDVIVVKPGERVPLDGVVLRGGSYLDVSSMTGESNFLSVSVGDSVLSGVVNVSGVLEIRVEKKYEDSTVKKVLDLIENVEDKKSKTENLIKRFAKIYTPCVVFVAFLMFVVPVFVFGCSWQVWLERCLIFLVISCPCALVISVPVSFFLAISKSAKNGILVKGSIFLEVISKINTAIFDKTGTLTKGEFVVKDVVSLEYSKEEVLRIVALAESKSNHPISKSIKNAYKKDLDLDLVEDVEEVFGKGVKAKIEGKEVFVGNKKLMNDIGIFDVKEDIAGTNVHLAIEKKYVGFVVLKDEIKEGAKKDLQKLRELGIKKLVMLTGDKKEISESIFKELCLDSVYFELLPFEKVEKLEHFLKEGPSIFVGDGVNDAASLKRADVGIAMGAIGSDAVMEAADVVLMDDDLKTLVKFILISKKAIRVVKQNIIFSLSFKGLICFLGAFGLTNIWLAIFSDVGISILAILNSFRALSR